MQRERLVELASVDGDPARLNRRSWDESWSLVVTVVVAAGTQLSALCHS
jgi:hypothetical protein